MKYEVRNTCMWGTGESAFRLDPNPTGSPDGVKVVDSAALVVNGKPLPGDVVQLFVRRKCLIPLKAETPPKVKEPKA